MASPTAPEINRKLLAKTLQDGKILLRNQAKLVPFSHSLALLAIWPGLIAKHP